MVSEARKQKLLAKRQARNRERGARAAIIAAAVIDQQDKKLSSDGPPFPDKETSMLDRRSIMAQARRQAREDLRTEKRHRKEQQALVQSAFLRLPAEVRCLIYEHVFADKQVIINADSSTLDSLTTNAKRSTRRDRQLRGAWALTAVCRIVRREVLQMTPCFSQLSFRFNGRGRLCRDDFNRWLAQLGPDRTSQIRTITLVGENKCTNKYWGGTYCTRTLRIDLNKGRRFYVDSTCDPEPHGHHPCGHAREQKMMQLLERVTGDSESGRTKVLDKALLNEVYGWLNSFIPE